MTALKEPTSPQVAGEPALQVRAEAAVLQCLETAAPLRAGAPLTGLPATLSRWATGMLVSAGCLEFVLGITAVVLVQSGAVKTFSPAAQLCIAGLVLAAALAIGAMLLQTASGVLGILSTWKRPMAHFPQEMAHDMAEVGKLACFPLDALFRTQEWLDWRIRRLERRRNLLIGSPDKVALLSIMVGGWAAYRELSAFVSSGGWPSMAVIFVAAFLAGMSVGGMLQAVLLQHFEYMRDVLHMAIRRKESRLPDRRHLN